MRTLNPSPLRDRLLRLLPLIAAIVLALFAAERAISYALEFRDYTGLSTDEQNYIAMARRLLAEGTYSFFGEGPDAYVSPGFPLFLTAFFALFGSGNTGLWAVRIFQCLLLGGTVFIVYALGRTFTRRSAPGLIAAVLLSLNGGYRIFTRMMLTETTYYFCMMLSFLLLARACRRESTPRFAAAGIVFGVAVMIRSLVVAALPFLLLFLFVHRRKAALPLRPVFFFLGGFLLACAPWWIRNLLVLHKLVLWTTQTDPIYAGLLPDVSSAGLSNPGSYLGNFKLLFRLMREQFRPVLSWMTFGKFRLLFMMEDMVPMPVLSALVRNFTVCLGFGGAALSLLRRETRLQSLPFWVYLICIFFSIPEVRYAYQYELILALFAGWLLDLGWQKLKEPKQSNQKEADL